MSTEIKQNVNTIQDNGGQGCVIRYRFFKGETVRYISHLDMLHTFERAIRRAQIPISYSRGYNPHPSMIFGMALSLGISSECEVMDLGLAEKADISQIMHRANAALPMDLQLLEGSFTPPKNSVMAAVYAGTYSMLVSAPGGTAGLQQALDAMSHSQQVMADKRSKDTVKQVDIRPMIKEMQVWDYTGHDSDHIIFKASDHPAAKAVADAWALAAESEHGALSVLRLDCTMGTSDNLRPDMFINGLSHFMGCDVKCIKIHKREMLLR